MNLRITTAGAVAAALALAVSPAAQAKVTVEGSFSVCNTASQNWQGDDGSLAVSPQDPYGALRYSTDLKPKKMSPGLLNAAWHSHALALCDGGDDGAYSGGSVDGDPTPTGGGTT